MGYYLVCENIAYGDFDEKFDGICDFADFIQNFLSFLWAVHSVSGANIFTKTLL